MEQRLGLTGDRARDVNETLRAEVEKRLIKLDARPESIRAVHELVVVGDQDRAAFFRRGFANWPSFGVIFVASGRGAL